MEGELATARAARVDIEQELLAVTTELRKLQVCFCWIRVGQNHICTLQVCFCWLRVGQNHIYVRCIYIRFFGREITKYAVIFGVYIQFWPVLPTRSHAT